MEIQDATNLVEKELKERGISFEKRFEAISATIPNVTAFNPAANREITGDASITFYFKGKISVEGNNLRGRAYAEGIDWLPCVEITTKEKTKTKKDYFYGAIDEESF